MNGSAMSKMRRKSTIYDTLLLPSGLSLSFRKKKNRILSQKITTISINQNIHKIFGHVYGSLPKPRASFSFCIKSPSTLDVAKKIFPPQVIHAHMNVMKRVLRIFQTVFINI